MIKAGQIIPILTSQNRVYWAVAIESSTSSEAINEEYPNGDLGWTMAVHNHTLKTPVEGVASPPIRDIQDSGILWGMGSDGTVVSTYSPFHTIWEYTAGRVFPDIVKYQSDEVITPEQALMTMVGGDIVFQQ